MRKRHKLSQLLVLLAIASRLSSAWASLPDDQDKCAIRYSESFNYFVIDPDEMKAKSGHDFPRGHETFRLHKKSEHTFEFFHPDSDKYLCISPDNQLIPCNGDDTNKAEFELKPLIDVSSLGIKDHSRISLARFFLLKLDGDFIKLKGNSFEKKREINKDDLGDITLVDVANMANLDSEPHIFDFIHAFQGILNDDTSFLNFDFIVTKEINDFKINLYKRRDGQFQIFSFRGTSTPSNVAFDIFTIGGNFHRYKHTFDEILTFINSYKNETKSYISGQSMGGFLAQIFAVLSDSEGLSISGPSAVNFLKRHYYNEYQTYNESGRKFHNLSVQGDVVPKVKSSYGHLDNALESIHSDVDPPKYSEYPRALFGIHPTHYHEVLNKHYFLSRIKKGRAFGFKWQESTSKMDNISRELNGQTIAIQSKNSKYFISSNQRILASSLGRAANEQKGWEKFQVVQDEDSDYIYLQDFWGWFLSAEKDGRVSQKKDPREWEQFKIWQDDAGTIYFQSFHGTWLKIGPTGQVFCESRLNNSAELDIKNCD